MDEATLAQIAADELDVDLKRIAAAKTRGDLVDLFVEPGFDSPVEISIYPDLKNPTRYAAYAGQDGLGMPNRDYYLLKGAKYDAYRKAYRDYIVEIQRLAGISDPEARADRIIALETAIAKFIDPEQSRDVDKIYNPMTRAQLRAFAPQLDWDRALAKLKLSGTTSWSLTRRVHPGRGEAIRLRPAADLEGLDRRPLHQRQCAISCKAVRRREIQFLLKYATRRAEAA
jgi:endothelin-converting enzyme/putative endopeptidase